MSRTVSGVFGVAIAGSSSGFAPSKASDSAPEGGSFWNALDRAQGNGRGSAGASSTKSTKSEAPKDVQDSASRKAVPKKATSAVADQSPKAEKKPDLQTPAEDQKSDSGQASPEGSADQQHEQSDPRHKKTGPIVDAATNDPAAIVQLQGTLPQPQVLGTSPSSPLNDEGGPRNPPKAQVAMARKSGTMDAGKTATQEDPASATSKAGVEDSTNSAASPNPAPSESGAGPTKAHLAIEPKSTDGNPVPASTGVAAGAQQQLASSQGAGASPVSAPLPAPAPVAGASLPSIRPVPSAADDPSLVGLTPQITTGSNGDQTVTAGVSDADAPVPSPDAQFADVNHPKIISGITGRLLPNGGAMQIRLDPPELGALQIRVEMRDGVMTASFETSNDQATRLLSHSLGDLRNALEAQGVSVQKLQVSQSPKQQSSSGDSQQDSSKTPQDTASQQEQQRKEMVRRMWQKLMNGQDPVDLVA